MSGGGTVPVFDVGPGVTATISGLTIENGGPSTSWGTGIFNDGTLTVNNSTTTEAPSTWGRPSLPTAPRDQTAVTTVPPTSATTWPTTGPAIFGATGSLSNTPSGLDPSGPQNNGGPTQTILLDPGSAAIDHVSNGSQCPATDRRGAPRTTPCDIGAYDTDEGPFVDVSVTGSQTYGGPVNLSQTNDALPGVTVSGTLSCSTVNRGKQIYSPPGSGLLHRGRLELLRAEFVQPELLALL